MKKKSKTAHAVQGTYRSDRHGKPRLQYPAGTATAPKHLGKLAKQEWNRIAPLLVAQNLLAETDVGTLAAYCNAYAGYRECAEIVKEQGQILTVESTTRTGKTTKPIRNPAVTLMLDYQRAMLAAAAKFGFSPYDRERIEGANDLRGTARGTSQSNPEGYGLMDVDL